MRQLYNLQDALKYMRLIKKRLFELLILGVVLLIVIIFLTVLSPTTFVMIIDIILTSIYLSLIYVYVFFYRPNLQNAYQFLAKIQHYPLTEEKGEVKYISTELVTLLNKLVQEVTLNNGHSVFIERDFISYIKEGQFYHFSLMQNIIIALSEESKDVYIEI